MWSTAYLIYHHTLFGIIVVSTREESNSKSTARDAVRDLELGHDHGVVYHAGLVHSTACVLWVPGEMREIENTSVYHHVLYSQSIGPRWESSTDLRHY